MIERTPLKQLGKQGEYYRVWRNQIARPYLDKRFGRDCSLCKTPPPVNEETGEVGYHDVDHINKRGSHPQDKYKVKNIRYLCSNCHGKETVEKSKVRVDK